jgi:hypothetical protein
MTFVAYNPKNPSDYVAVEADSKKQAQKVAAHYLGVSPPTAVKVEPMT